MMVALSIALIAQQFSSMPVDGASAWRDVSKSIQQLYYARQSGAKRMNDLFSKYGPLASKATNQAQFSDLVKHMIDDFGDSHFDFLTRSDQGFYLMDALTHRSTAGQKMPFFGAWFRKTAEGYRVQMVLDGSSAKEAGLRKGDLVVSVNNRPFSPVDSLLDLSGNVTLSIERKGQRANLVVQVQSKGALEAFLDASVSSTKVFEEGDKKFGYFHLWTQANPDFKSALDQAVYGSLSKTDGMILDIRDGFGGRPEGYGDAFFRPGVTISTSGISSLYGYGKPLVLLINEGSRSAKEVLSYLFKKSGRAVLIGHQTAGAVLGTFPRAIGNWAYIEIPMVDIVVDGVRLERNGVKPDIEVPVEIDDSGKDLALDAALNYLKQMG